MCSVYSSCPCKLHIEQNLCPHSFDFQFRDFSHRGSNNCKPNFIGRLFVKVSIEQNMSSVDSQTKLCKNYSDFRPHFNLDRNDKYSFKLHKDASTDR